MAVPARAFWTDQDAAASRILQLMRLKVSGTMMIDPDCFDAVRIEEDIDYLARHLVLRFEGHVYGQRLANHVESRDFDQPATWWDHWKLAHADTRWAGWCARRWPPTMRKITLTATWENYAAYPTFKGVDLAPHDFGQVIHYVLPPKHRIEDYYFPSKEH